ncbi:TrkA C-terminal domain-containing protein [Streptococcus iniae]|uniref:TrkA C-terminal domain-containing protein n=1 Tax=Streptococcus iniae TaxID=1346 RepID=UPI002B2E8B00|nr:TrkA C-terminal domain-containing protein [Streptococcus iniae]WNZ90608.1 TrkA C-terminal domain-containing protein [Streptococcus iniae]WNZ92242.1 TrkA C-terminal domain-containing protein [Streptococcus iniae]
MTKDVRKREVGDSKYQKIAISVAQRIASGEYEVGEKLKSRTTIASTFNVSPETARKGLNILADLNILTLKHGSGAIVLSKEKAIEFINQYETTHSIAVIKEDIRENLKEHQEGMERLSLLVNDFLMQSQSISKQFPLAPYEIIVNKDSEHFGKSIGVLNLWHQTGATVVAIEHQGELLISPGPYAVIKKGDHVYFVGDDQVYSRMKNYFNLSLGL